MTFDSRAAETEGEREEECGGMSHASSEMAAAAAAIGEKSLSVSLSKASRVGRSVAVGRPLPSSLPSYTPQCPAADLYAHM